MNSRERFLAVLRYEAVDVTPLPCLLQCFETETIQRWYREGLRRDAHVVQQFGFERIEVAPVILGPLPPLETADVEESEEWRAGTDREHVDAAIGRADAAREHFPIRSREHWSAMRRRLDPASPARYPRFFADYCRERADRDYPLGLQLTGPFSGLREWMGLRHLGTAIRAERSWVEEMVAYLVDFIVQATQRVARSLDLDFAIIREPWAYRADTVGSFDEFGQLFRPFYRQVTDFFREAGIPTVFILTKGPVAQLIPFWLANGVNGLGYLEASAGLDATSLRKRYGRDLALIGNLDHQALAGQWRDIADEVLAKAPPLLEQGGYFPTVDRPVPSDVPLENFEYYLALLRYLGGERAAEWVSHERKHVWSIFQPAGGRALG